MSEKFSQIQKKSGSMIHSMFLSSGPHVIRSYIHNQQLTFCLSFLHWLPVGLSRVLVSSHLCFPICSGILTLPNSFNEWVTPDNDHGDRAKSLATWIPSRFSYFHSCSYTSLAVALTVKTLHTALWVLMRSLPWGCPEWHPKLYSANIFFSLNFFLKLEGSCFTMLCFCHTTAWINDQYTHVLSLLNVPLPFPLHSTPQVVTEHWWSLWFCNIFPPACSYGSLYVS